MAENCKKREATLEIKQSKDEEINGGLNNKAVTEEEVKGDLNEEVKESVEKPMDLDEVLAHELGQFGWFQIRNILLVAYPIILCGLMTEYIFSAAATPHR